MNETTTESIIECRAKRMKETLERRYRTLSRTIDADGTGPRERACAIRALVFIQSELARVRWIVDGE